MNKFILLSLTVVINFLANGQNLVLNGSFESPVISGCSNYSGCGFTSWSTNCVGTPNSLIPFCGSGTPNPTDGNQAMQMYSEASSGILNINQTIAVVPCNTYTFSFDYSSVYSAVECFDWSISGGHVASGQVVGSTSWQSVNITFTPTSNSVTISFTNSMTSNCSGSTNSYSYTSPQLDNVSIEAISSGEINTSENLTVCDSTIINGVSYTSSQTFIDTFATSNCDSIHTVNLTVENSLNITDIEMACDSFIWRNGLTYNTSTNTPTYTSVSPSGCDTVYMLDLTINNSTNSTDVQTACNSYTWIDGITYTSSNNTASQVNTAVNGCDSIINLDLTIGDSFDSTEIYSTCGPFIWKDGVSYSTSTNTPTFIGVNASGCDTIFKLDLTINNSVSTSDVQSACDSFTWINGVTYTSSNNTASQVLTSFAGCDSTVNLDLTIQNSLHITDTQIACDSYIWKDGINYSSSTNTPTFMGVNTNGCDTFYTLNLSIMNSVSYTDQRVACNTYTWIDGVTYTSSNNSASQVLTSVTGCDSIVNLDLTITNSLSSTDEQTACDSFTWIDGNVYAVNNDIATYTTLSIDGCDSVVHLDLTIINTPDVNPTASEDTIAIGNQVLLSVFDNGINYEWNTGENGNSIIVFPNETSTYNVVASNELCFDTGYVQVTVLEEEVQLVLSNAFSPNGDGKNDLFRIVNEEDFTEITMNIYNRWGELIFVGVDENHAWDGIFKEEPQNIGLYIYSVDAVAKQNGEHFYLVGNVSLIR